MEGDGMQGKYIPQQIEKKWQQIWEETKAFETHFDPNKKKYYAVSYQHLTLRTISGV